MSPFPLPHGISKGHFTLQLLVKQIRDSINLIGGEEKFFRSAFTLEANCQWTKASKIPTWQHFLGVLVPKVCMVEEKLSTIFMEIQTFLEQTNFFF